MKKLNIAKALIVISVCFFVVGMIITYSHDYGLIFIFASSFFIIFGSAVLINYESELKENSKKQTIIQNESRISPDPTLNNK